jgi:hypothetical protein
MPHNDPAMRKANINYGSAKARAAKKGALVNLTNEEDKRMRALYLNAAQLTLAGNPHEVDHIVPLALGGKHHPRNLQILPKAENAEKRAAKGKTISKAPAKRFKVGDIVLAQQVNGKWETREINEAEWVFDEQQWLYYTDVPTDEAGLPLWAKEDGFWESDLKRLPPARRGFALSKDRDVPHC